MRPLQGWHQGIGLIQRRGSGNHQGWRDYADTDQTDSAESCHTIADQRFGPAIKEFELTVPSDYNHDTQIDTFAQKTKKLKTTYYFNNLLTSENFAKATNKLEPGKTYKAKIFPILSRVSSEDCMTFLRKQHVILVGGQGLMLTQDLKSDEFPIGKYTVSFDEKDSLCVDADGDRGVPSVNRIHKATVRDRVLHHLIHKELYPYFEKRFIYDE